MATAFAVYSADDQSLRFYNRDTVPTASDTFEGLTVTAIYTDFDNATYDYPMFVPWYADGYSPQLKNITVEDENIKPVNTAYWFCECKRIAIADLNKLDTSKVTDMTCMFSYCMKLTSLDLSGWDTSKVTTMTAMFNGCSSLVTLYVDDKWSIEAIVDSNGMFTDCTSIYGQSGTTYNSSEVNSAMANWETGYLTYNGYMVFGVFSEDDSSLLWYRRKGSKYVQALKDGTYEGRTCTALEECTLDKDKRVVDFHLFARNEADKFIVVDNIPVASLVSDSSVRCVKKLDVRRLDVSACTSFNDIFNCLSYNTDMESTKSITWLDLSTWDTSSATSMNFMFNGSSDIKRIYVGDKWSVANITSASSSSMFTGCINLVGGSGIVYDETKVDMTMANWDTGYLSKTKRYLVQDPSLTALGDAIRDKAGTTGKMTLDEMATAVEGISTGYELAEGLNCNGAIYYTTGDSVPAGKSNTTGSISPGCGSTAVAVAIAPNVTSVGINAFANCTALTYVDLPMCSDLGKHYSFQGCLNGDGSRNLHMTLGLTTVTEYMFYINSSTSGYVQYSIFGSTNSPCNVELSIDLPNATSIGVRAFYGCSALTSIELPNATSIGDYAFDGCSALTSIDLPSVVTIEGGSFHNLAALTVVDLGKVESFGQYAFRLCSELTTIVIRQSEKVCSMTLSYGQAALYTSCRNLASIYVPDALVDSYKSTTGWSSYASKIKPLSEYKG